MKRSLLPFIALALAAGACSSNSASMPAKSIAAVPAGTLQTAWGEMPTYRAEGSQTLFALDRSHRHGGTVELREGEADVRTADTIVLDVLVARDGSVRDVKVQASSGLDRLDHLFMNEYVGARSLLQLAATDAAPYVIRQTIKGVTPMGRIDHDSTR